VSRPTAWIDGVQQFLPPGDLVAFQNVDVDLFSVLRQRVIEGRGFTALDRGTPLPVAIVNQSAAATLSPTSSILGKRIGLWAPYPQRSGSHAEVVGVVADTRFRNLTNSGQAVAYFVSPRPAAEAIGSLMIRTTGHPRGAMQRLIDLARQHDPDVPIEQAYTAEERMATFLMPQRLGAGLLGLFAATALAVTLISIYGVVTFVSTRLTREIGLRLALGASPAQIARLTAREAGWPICVGLVAGAILIAWGGNVADRFMYGLSGRDPMSGLIAASVIVLAGFVAIWLPTRRALRLSPADALRAE
jgi:hypothetical protein